MHKLILNRLCQSVHQSSIPNPLQRCDQRVQMLSAEVIAGLEPILAHHFNLTVELPLKAIIRGYSFAVIPISWTNRTSGVSKLKIREMGSRYLFIVIYCFIERLLSRGDYRRKPVSGGLAGNLKAVSLTRWGSGQANSIAGISAHPGTSLGIT